MQVSRRSPLRKARASCARSAESPASCSVSEELPGEPRRVWTPPLLDCRDQEAMAAPPNLRLKEQGSHGHEVHAILRRLAPSAKPLRTAQPSQELHALRRSSWPLIRKRQPPRSGCTHCRARSRHCFSRPPGETSLRHRPSSPRAKVLRAAARNASVAAILAVSSGATTQSAFGFERNNAIAPAQLREQASRIRILEVERGPANRGPNDRGRHSRRMPVQRDARSLGSARWSEVTARP